MLGVRLDEVPGVWCMWVRVLLVSIKFDDLPVLADALEEAGCDNREILAHYRSGGEHVRGCWVVDLMLGKE